MTREESKQMEQMRLMDVLESEVDKNSLYFVIEALGLICDAKAGHIRENWQDKITAKPWEQMAQRLETCAGAAREKSL